MVNKPAPLRYEVDFETDAGACSVEVKIDAYELARILAAKALRSKSQSAGLAFGAVNLKVTAFTPKKGKSNARR